MKKEKCFAALGLALASIVTVAGAKSAFADDLIIKENGSAYQLPVTREITNAYFITSGLSCVMKLRTIYLSIPSIMLIESCSYIPLASLHPHR